MAFPQFRMNSSRTSYFKILSSVHFIEIQRIGEKLVRHEVKAIQYPELNLINDMLALYDRKWMVIGPKEFEAVESEYFKARRNLR